MTGIRSQNVVIDLFFSKASWLHLPACFISIPSVSETCMCERQRKARTWMGTCSEWCTCRMRDNELWVAIRWCKTTKCILLSVRSTATLSFHESQFHDAFCSIVLSISATVFHYNFLHVCGAARHFYLRHNDAVHFIHTIVACSLVILVAADWLRDPDLPKIMGMT